MKLALTYDDIQLIPQYSSVKSRTLVNLQTQVSKNYKLDIPVIASCMDTICETEMAVLMNSMGGAGIVHRFQTMEDQYNMVQTICKNKTTDNPIMGAIGVNGDYLERAFALEEAGCDILVLDVAHGFHKNVKTALSKLKNGMIKCDIIAGSIADRNAASRLEDWGADGLRVGIGGGSICKTRIQTGFGVPSVTSILNCRDATTIPVIADGGLKTSGDIAKAIAVGANAVMLGSMLSATSHTPGKVIQQKNGLYKQYRGLASMETKTIHGQPQRNVEGVSALVEYKGDTAQVLASYLQGLRSALSYGGADTIPEFQENVDWYQVTNAGNLEGQPHILK